MELDWSDLRSFDDFSFTKSGKDDTSEVKNSEKEEEDKNAENKQADMSSYEINDWNDMRKLDDDHDDDWFKAQERKLAEQYGGNFIKVKYCNNGRVAYFCELCLAECNAKKSLELHCSGMKHLKKKDLWEKEGKPQPPISIAAEENSKGPPTDPADRRGPPSMNNRGRGRGGRAGFGYHPRDSFDRRDDRDFDGPGRGGRGYNRFFPDEEFPRDPYFQPFAPPPPPMAAHDYRDSIRGLSPEGSYDSFARKDYGHGRSRGLDDSYGERKSSPVRPRYYGDNDSRDSRSKGQDSRSNRDGYGRSRSRERERRRSPVHSRDSRRSPGRSKDSRRSPQDSRRSPYRTPAAPSPPRFNRSSEHETDGKVNLVASPAGSLLQKLSECCVKSNEDADLALSVVASLTKSLKEYSQRNNEVKIAELLMEAELKVGTVKALKVGMKMLSNFADASTIKKPEDFLNTLTESATRATQGADTLYNSNIQGWGALPYYK